MRSRFSASLTSLTAPCVASLLVAGAAAACGSLAASESDPSALATLSGEVVNENALAVAGAVRVAVVWQAPEGEFNVAQDLPIQTIFPSSFTIQLDDPPPASAMTDGAELFGTDFRGPTSPTGANGSVPSGHKLSQAPAGAGLHVQGGAAGASGSDLQVAVGTVVAYVDKNGNGKLDLVAEGASGYVDQILATNQNELIFYFQGTIPAAAADEVGNAPVPGYNLHMGCDESIPTSPSPGSICAVAVADAGAAPPACADAWQDIHTKLTLAVSSDPEVSSIMCRDPAESSSESSGATQTLSGRPASYPSPCDGALGCFPDGSSYTYTACTTLQQGLCEGTTTSCTSVMYSRPSPVPSDWPCKS